MIWKLTVEVGYRKERLQ